MKAPIALVLLAFALAGCGGDDREVVPAAWCSQTLEHDHKLERFASPRAELRAYVDERCPQG